MSMHNPPHPGEVLSELYLEPLQLSVTDAADALGVRRTTLSRLLNGRHGVSTEMALRLAEALDTSPQYWLNMQQAFDLWEAKKEKKKLGVRKLTSLAQQPKKVG